MNLWKKLRKFLAGFLDAIFSITYILMIILAILDIFGILTVIATDMWSKVLVMIFGTVGIVIISDKHKLEKEIKPQIDEIMEHQNNEISSVESIEQIVGNIFDRANSNINIKYFPDKTQFYLFLSELLLKLPNGARIDVTSFEKNYNVPYAVGEDGYIETFMKSWNQMVKGGSLQVRQLVHVTTPQDYKELKERVETFRENYNFAISAIVGLPIAPFLDFMVINQEYVVMGFSNDSSSPNNLSFGFVVQSKELALNFQNYFNVYWAGQFSVIVKDKDEIKKKNLDRMGEYVFDIEHDDNLIRYHEMMLALYRINEHNKKIMPMLDNLNRFYDNMCFELIQDQVEKKLAECSDLIYKKMHNYLNFQRIEAAAIIAKMMFNAKKEILAVSLDIDGSEFWQADEGEKIFNANVDAISKRGVTVQRIFVCPLEKKVELESIMKEQIDAGIEVYYTEYRKGMGGTFEDFLIVDKKSLLVFESKGVKVSFQKSHINKYIERFNRIKNLGEKY